MRWAWSAVPIYWCSTNPRPAWTRARTALSVEQLRALPEVQHVRPTEAGVEILSARGTQTLRALLDADPDVAGLEVRAADLETAFLALTDDTTQEAA